MTDIVEITEGLGTGIAVDQVGAAAFQRVQPAEFRRRQVSALVTAGGLTYADEDAVAAALELTNFGRDPFQSGVIEQVVVALDDPAASATVEAMFFDNAAPTVAGAADPFEPSFADLSTFLGSVPLGAPTVLGANRQWWGSAGDVAANLAVPYVLTGTSMWVVLVARSAFGAIAAANEWKIGVTARLD